MFCKFFLFSFSNIIPNECKICVKSVRYNDYVIGTVDIDGPMF